MKHGDREKERGEKERSETLKESKGFKAPAGSCERTTRPVSYQEARFISRPFAFDGLAVAGFKRESRNRDAARFQGRYRVDLINEEISRSDPAENYRAYLERFQTREGEGGGELPSERFVTMRQ